jgi:hypothetical protein
LSKPRALLPVILAARVRLVFSGHVVLSQSGAFGASLSPPRVAAGITLGRIEMTDLTKIAGSQEHGSSLDVGALMATVAVVFLLIAMQGMFIAKHAITLNAAAESALFGIIAP